MSSRRPSRPRASRQKRREDGIAIAATKAPEPTGYCYGHVHSDGNFREPTRAEWEETKARIKIEMDGFHAKRFGPSSTTLALLIIRIGAAGMIGDVQDVDDGGNKCPDLVGHALFQCHIGHAATLATPFKAQIGRIADNIN